MAAAPELVDEAMRATLAPVPISLSEKLAAGVTHVHGDGHGARVRG